jgi:hypothetical protein
MLKSERIALYEWVEKNENKKGKEYPKTLDCTQCDYIAIRQKLRKFFPYADYEIVENNRDQKYLKVFIKS